MWYIVIAIASAVLFLLFIALLANSIFENTFKKYDLIKSTYGEPSQKVLGRLLFLLKLDKIKLGRLDSEYGDCYIPKKKMIVMSKSTINNTSISAITIVCHEIGHAQQHKEKSDLYIFRRFLVWTSYYLSKLMLPLLVVGIIFLFFNTLQNIGIVLLWTCVGIIGLSILVKLVTIPLELDASKRAMLMLTQYQIFNEQEAKKARHLLDLAALTYISDFITYILGINYIRNRRK